MTKKITNSLKIAEKEPKNDKRRRYDFRTCNGKRT